MANTKAKLIFTLLLLSTVGPAAGASVMRVHADGQLEKMQTESFTDLANMFADDLEANAVASKISTLAAGTPSDELLPFVQKLKKDIQPWHDGATATLQASIEKIESCKETMDSGMQDAEAHKSSCSEKSTSHTRHRQIESTKYGEKVAAKSEVDVKEEIKSTECTTFETVKGEAKAASAAYVSGDVEAYLESVKMKFCDGLLPRYTEADTKCTTAKTELTKALEVFKSKDTAYTDQKNTSDNVQTKMDVGCCKYSIETKDVCTSFDACYENKVAAYASLKGTIQAEEKVKKVEWRVYSRIECLLPLLGTNEADKIKECRDKTHDTSHLDIDYPAIPNKSNCHIDEAFPGTNAYYTTHFGTLPEDAKGKDVQRCTGMVECPDGMTEFVDAAHYLCSTNGAASFGGVVAGWGNPNVLSPARVCTRGEPYTRPGVWNMFHSADIPIRACPA